MKYYFIMVSTAILYLTICSARGQNVGPAGITQFVKDGKVKNVMLDTVTPANSTPLPVTLSGGAVIGSVDQGSPNSLANGWPMKITDGTDMALVSAAGELSVVFTNAIPAGANNIGSIANVTGTVSLPTGASTEATLSAINGKFGSLGQKTMAGSAPVVIASDQSAIPVSAASLPLPTGAATSALQTTGNTSLSSIDGKIANNYGAAAGAVRTAAQVGNASGVADFAAGNSSAQTLRTVIATDQAAIATKAPVNSAGNSPGSSTVSVVATLTAPANAVGFILMNLDTSTANIRYRIGAAAAVGSGQQLQPGRDTGYIPCAANVSIIAEAGTQNYDIQWILSN